MLRHGEGCKNLGCRAMHTILRAPESKVRVKRWDLRGVI